MLEIKLGLLICIVLPFADGAIRRAFIERHYSGNKIEIAYNIYYEWGERECECVRMGRHFSRILMLYFGRLKRRRFFILDVLNVVPCLIIHRGEVCDDILP